MTARMGRFRSACERNGLLAHHDKGRMILLKPMQRPFQTVGIDLLGAVAHLAERQPIRSDGARLFYTLAHLDSGHAKDNDNTARVYRMVAFQTRKHTRYAQPHHHKTTAEKEAGVRSPAQRHGIERG